MFILLMFPSYNTFQTHSPLLPLLQTPTPFHRDPCRLLHFLQKRAAPPQAIKWTQYNEIQQLRHRFSYQAWTRLPSVRKRIPSAGKRLKDTLTLLLEVHKNSNLNNHNLPNNIFVKSYTTFKECCHIYALYVVSNLMSKVLIFLQFIAIFQGLHNI